MERIDFKSAAGKSFITSELIQKLPQRLPGITQ